MNRPLPANGYRGASKLKNLKFYAVKMPLVYCIAAIGFVFEFLTTLPFAIASSIDARRGNRKKIR